MVETWRIEPPRRKTAYYWAGGGLAVLAVVAAFCAGGLLVGDPGAEQSPTSAPTGAASSAPVPRAMPTSATAAVPGVVDLRLTDAEAMLSVAGFTPVQVVDATGQGRAVLERKNWIVVSQDPAPGTPADPSTVVKLTVRKPTDGMGDTDTTRGVVPDVVCKDLQSAQDALRAAGFFVVRSKDGTGQGRFQAVDRNWLVIEQSARAGTSPEFTSSIMLTVVKFGEPTGDSGCRS
ncbi:PASTA domain-containing protein [Catellatospora sp. NPDC049609]|uniref:PASTA domain-containing protein n=1 Tax=Catellatospora sp. NPDC049609 TaxID=3155505 RepID=UPI0034416199